MIKLNGAKLDYFKFSAGEVHFELKEPLRDEESQVEMYFESNDDIICLMLLADLFATQEKEWRLFAPYLPYSRQDRSTTPNSPNSFSVMMRAILSSGMCREISTYDLHNPKVIPKLLPHNTEFTNIVALPTCATINSKDSIKTYLIVPDEGAKERCEHIAKHHNYTIAFQGHKVRNPSTGALSHYSLEPLIEKIPRLANFIVFDDICDGGGTFVLLAEAIKQTKPLMALWMLHLSTTHGIYSRGKEELNKHYKSITCRYNLKTMEIYK
jgi:ribose-phosphate pyrophosphokinase